MNTTSLGGAIAIDVSGAPSAFAVAFMQLSDVMNNFTTKPGGRVFEGPLLDMNQDGSRDNRSDGPWHEAERGTPVGAAGFDG